MSTTPTEIADLKAAAAGRIDELAPRLIDLSHRIHSHPELAFEERETVSALVETAASEGLAAEASVFGLETAFVADFGEVERPRVTIVSEFDALPEVDHACGHNLIATIGLGAALGLNSVVGLLPGSVRWLGTPAEERGCGKELLARAGAFDEVDAAMMVHPASWNLRAIHSICLAEVEVTFIGRATHAGLNPGAGRNALDAAVLSYQAVAQLFSQLRLEERVQGVIPEGGSLPSVLPERTRVVFYLRAPTRGDLEGLKERVERCIQGAAQATRCEARVRRGDADYAGMRVNESLAEAFEANATSLGRDFTPYEGFPPAVTDMGNVSERVPSLHSVIACAPPTVMLHEPEFATWAASSDGDKALIDGAKALAMTALDFLCDDELRRRVQAEFDDSGARSSVKVIAGAN